MSCSETTTSMSGKTCVVTGANTGIGRETAIALARLGALVVLVARSRERGEAALAEVIAAGEAGGRGGSGELEIADLSVQSQVRALATTITTKYPVLDVLVNNAGLALRKRTLSTDGIEMTFAVNFLAYFMLANLLLPSLLKAPSARIVNVASGAHAAVRTLDFDNLQGEKRFRGYGAYAMSKLEDVMLTYALARRLAATSVTVNTLHPGVIASEIWRSSWLFRTVGTLFMASPKEGAVPVVRLAADAAVGELSGRYFEKCDEVKTTPLSRDELTQERLWSVAEGLTGVTWSGVVSKQGDAITSED